MILAAPAPLETSEFVITNNIPKLPEPNSYKFLLSNDKIVEQLDTLFLSPESPYCKQVDVRYQFSRDFGDETCPEVELTIKKQKMSRDLCFSSKLFFRFCNFVSRFSKA